MMRAAFVWLSLSAYAAAAEPVALLRTHCTACHNADQAEAELNLNQVVAQPHALRSDFRLLTRVVEAVSTGAMPPSDAESSLSPAEREQLLTWLKAEMNAVAAAQEGDPGLVVMPRLTRNEYRNVIRDLSGAMVTQAGEFLPNEGGAGEGFANVGEAQGMNAAQFEKYIEAAKGALKYLRVSPHDGLVWRSMPREAVDDRKAAIKEATDDIIDWYVMQQQKWGRLHRDDLQARLGFSDAVYLEAAWRATHGRKEPDEKLAPVALEKWTRILNDDETKSPFADWAQAWRAIPADVSDAKLRATCVAIPTDKRGTALAENKGDFAPPYEISFREAKEEVLAAAKDEGRWPFRIDLGDAKELFLILTDAGDGAVDEYGLWHNGRFIFKDGSAKPWQDVVKIVGANSGRPFPWGLDGANMPKLEADAVGQRPPGALKLAVPENAVVFEVDFRLDKNRTKFASVQALVLKEKPASQSFVPGRFVFGGKAPAGQTQADPNRERSQLLRKRNVSEALQTKLGLNAERNIFADWTRTSLEAVGGPWPDHTADKAEPNAPYYYTVAEVRRNATPEDLAELRVMEDRLVALAQPAANDAVESKAREWLSAFATKAWRRPVREVETTNLLKLYRDASAQGVSFDSAIKVPLLTVLLSRDFLYRGREADTFVVCANNPQAPLPLGSYALATRLSFFLWASIPDDELLELAAADKLRDPVILADQAKRMLKDPRAASLATDFAAQLWGFGDFGNFTGPDEKRFSEFTPALRNAMLEEVTLFLTDLIQNDQPLTALIDADYTFANGDLAQLYGLEREPTGFERVALPSGRGGLPTMALFLTKTSVPLRTSPVQRGVWIVEQLLGRRVPPPPANAGQISEDEQDASGLSIREQLARHRADDACAACHARIDPFGIALEGFDPIGRRRTADRSGDPIVSSETTHDGVQLNGVVGLKEYLVEHRDEVFAHFNRKLLGYALGRAVLPGDHALLERMNNSLTQNSYKFSGLVEAVVTSQQFMKRRPE
ncbi:MAG: hypothetical protein C0483_21025 [Pirellula sp.]|nr:hypothetical protein [Pirellula sp.]